MSKNSERKAYEGAVDFLVELSEYTVDDVERMKWFIRNKIKRSENIQKLRNMIGIVKKEFFTDPEQQETISMAYKAAQALHDVLRESDDGKQGDTMKWLTQEKNG